MSKKERIMIEPLSRVEGHGGIKVEIKANKVSNVEVQVLEGPRLFETLTLGKTPEEDLSIVPRICAICNLSHKYASLRALEKALGVQVTPITQEYRHLMHHGEMLESHSLHLYFLALPDFLGYDNAVAMADKYGDVVKKALQLKKFGNKIMRVMGGRIVHGENPVLGGFGRLPDVDTLVSIKREAQDLLPFVLDTVKILAGLKVPDHMERETQFVCLKPPHSGYDYYGDVIPEFRWQGVPAGRLQVGHKGARCRSQLAKRSLYNGKPFTSAAIARVLLLNKRLKGNAADAFKKLYNERWYESAVQQPCASGRDGVLTGRSR